MCSAKEVKKIVADSETKILGILNAEMQKIRLEIKENNDSIMTKTETSHQAVASTISGFGKDIQTMQTMLTGFVDGYSTKIENLEKWKIQHQEAWLHLKEDNVEIKDLIKWVGKLVMGAVILAVIGLVIK